MEVVGGNGLASLASYLILEKKLACDTIFCMEKHTKAPAYQQES